MICDIRPTALVGLLYDPVTNKPATDLNDCKIGWKNVFKGLRSACMIIETDFLKSVKFDEKFGVGSTYGAGEETDLLMNVLHHNKTIYFTRKVIMYHSDLKIQEIPLQKIASYAFGTGALCKKAVKNYSLLWGTYYLARTVIGNFIMWMVQGAKGNHDVAKARKYRAVYTIKGFMDYRVN